MPHEIDPSFIALPLRALADAALARARALGADHADFHFERVRSAAWRLRDGKPAGSSYTTDLGYAVRVVHGGAWGFASGVDLRVSMDRSLLDALASKFTEDGLTEQDKVFRKLRDLGKSPIEAIYVASRALGLSLPEAKTALYQSASWRDQHENWRGIQASLSDGPDNDLH